MIKLSPKLLMETYGKFICYCAACNDVHHFYTLKPNSLGLVWYFDKCLDEPSFYPDIKIYHADGRICHSVIVSGNVIYSNKSTHDFAGKTMALPDFPKELLNTLMKE